LIVTDYVFDDLFVMPVASALEEGKAIGSGDLSNADFKARLNRLVNVDPETYAKKVKNGQASGRKTMSEVQSRVKTTVLGALGLLKSKKITESDFRKRVTKTMKMAWRDSFLAGARAAGIPGTSASAERFKFESTDGAWLKSAMTHEMRYLNKFLDAILEDTGTMPINRRLGMYVDSLSSFYDSARVIGLPKNSLIYWSGPGDKVTCEGCRYMFENAPFTKYTLPTTPRAGATACLTNCRDRLLVRHASLSAVQEAEATGLSREQHLSALGRIKAGK
jgi:hypothetical protein